MCALVSPSGRIIPGRRWGPPLQNRGYLFNIGLKYGPEKNVGRISGNFCSFGVVFVGQEGKRAYFGKNFRKIVLNQTVESSFQY
ncbi:MAG: hypothetical protein D3904_11735 [Candidatus Electrothrix sp. EH2]|nr:hypothetical protein [Candidatus Electrothrix sp. EH2]